MILFYCHFDSLNLVIFCTKIIDLTITRETKAHAITVELLSFGNTVFTKGVVKPHDQIYKSWKSKTIHIYKMSDSLYKACFIARLLIFFATVHQTFVFSHYVHSRQCDFIFFI